MKPGDRTRAILTSKLDTTSKIVAVAIADHMTSADSEVWPSCERLGMLASLSERTVRTVLAAGHAEGWLRVTERKGDSSLLRIEWDALATVNTARTTGKRKAACDATPDRGSPRKRAHPGSGRSEPRIGAPGGSDPGAREGGVAIFDEKRYETPRIAKNASAPRSDEAEADHEAGKRKPPEARPSYVDVTPAPRQDTPSFEATICLPSGRSVPADLPGLLFGVRSGRRDAVLALLDAGIEDTRGLLRLNAHDRKTTPRMGTPLWNAIGDHLNEVWGVDLGCLSTEPVGGLSSRAEAERQQTQALTATLAHFGALNAVPES